METRRLVRGGPFLAAAESGAHMPQETTVAPPDAASAAAAPQDEGTALYDTLLATLSEMGEGVVVVENRRITHANAALCEMTGFSEAEMRAWPNYIQLWHPDEHERIMQNHLRRLAGEQFQAHYETALTDRNGERVDVELAASRLYSGQRIGVIVAFRDIRARKAVEAQLKRYTQDLERSNKALDEFAYIASHDLKEPLRGIHNYTSFLQEDYADRLDDQGRYYLERMHRLAERLTTLIDRLLRYSRLGSTALTITPVNLEHLLDDVVEDLLPSLRERQIEIRRPMPLPTLACDEIWIGELIQNLITNAAKYNDKPEKWVEIGVENRAGRQVFYVRDNGIGIPAQHQDTVFRIFKRLHEQEKFGGGSGAGLTIARKIVHRHGGNIWVESIEGAGCTICFTFWEENHATQA